jgi:hypothetical protein
VFKPGLPSWFIPACMLKKWMSAQAPGMTRGASNPVKENKLPECELPNE